MNIAVIFFIVLACIFAIISRSDKNRNTKTGLIFRFIWFFLVLSLFFFFNHKFPNAQNIFMGFVGFAGLVYFSFKFKKIAEN